MTVEVSDTVERYTISGTGPYAFSFRIFSASDLAVTVIDGAGLPTALVLDTQYTVPDASVNDEDGGTLSLIAAIATLYAGLTLDIRSNTPIEQLTGLENQGAFRLQAIEAAFDRQTRQLQDVERRLQAALRLPDHTQTDAALSPLLNWLSKYVYISASGEPEPAAGISNITLTKSVIAGLLFPQTAAESAAGVTPTDYAYPPGDARRYGVAASASAAANTISIANAIAAVPNDGGVVLFPDGVFNHNGIVLKPRVILMGAGRQATELHNQGAGVGITVPALSNSCGLASMNVTGVSTSTHGVRIIDSLYFRANDLFIKGWGDNSTGLLIDTPNSPGGNGSFFGEYRGVEVDGILRTGARGVHVTGTASGSNRNRWYGGVVHNCVVGMQLSGNTDGFIAHSPELNGNTTAVILSASSESLWIKPVLEANTEHFNISALASDHTILFPTLATPNALGTDAGVRTNVIHSQTGTVGPSRLAGDMQFGGKLAGTNYGFTAGAVIPVVASAAVTTVANTAAQTQLHAGFTAPASTLLVGDVFEIWASGVYSTANGVDTLTIRLFESVGGTIIWDHVTTAAAVANKGWKIHGFMVVTAQGVGGAIEAQIESRSNGVVNPAGNAAVIAIGTTGAVRTFKLNAIWSNALAGNTVSIRQFVMKAMNKQ